MTTMDKPTKQLTTLPKIITVLLSLTVVGCTPNMPDYTPEEIAKIKSDNNYDWDYQNCIDRVTGTFSSASAEVMKVCADAAKQGRSIP